MYNLVVRQYPPLLCVKQQRLASCSSKQSNHMHCHSAAAAARMPGCKLKGTLVLLHHTQRYLDNVSRTSMFEFLSCYQSMPKWNGCQGHPSCLISTQPCTSLSLQEACNCPPYRKLITQGDQWHHDHYLAGGPFLLEPKGHKTSVIAKPPS